MTSTSEPGSTKPYLIRAIHEWCTDNGFTPYLAVSVDERTIVPREHVKAGEIVLNVSHGATGRLQMGNELITFQARFGGVARDLSIPVDNVSAIYARENGHGMAFEVPKALAVTEPSKTADGDHPDAPPSLVADDATPPSAEDARLPFGQSGAPPALTSVPSTASTSQPDDAPPTDPNAPKGGRPKLTRVK